MDLSPLPILDAAENYRGEFVDLDGAQTVAAPQFHAGRAQLVERLAREGLSAGDRIVFAVDNGPDFVAALVAILTIGASPVLVHSKTPPAELKRTAQRYGARFLLAGECPADALETVAGPIVPLSIGDWGQLVFATVTLSQSDAARSFFKLPGVPLHPTSGTTGQPKVAVRPGRAAVEEARHYIETIGVTSADTIAAITPMSHAYAFGMCVMVPLLAGARVVSMRNFQASRVFEALAHHRLTILPAVPAMLDVLVFGAGDRLRGAVRTVLSAGSPLSERTAARFFEKSGIAVRPLYGTTETGGISVAPGRDEQIAGTCVGPPMRGVEARVMPDPEHRDAQPGVGRLHIRSSSMMVGYYGPAGIDAAPINDGWFTTGDLAWIDPSGRIHLLGRETDVINVSGLKVIPLEVEEVIAGLAGVLDVKVYAGQRRGGGQFVKAAVVCEPGVDAVTIRAHCEANLVYYKRPERILPLDRLPRSPAGKILRDQLP